MRRNFSSGCWIGFPTPLLNRTARKRGLSSLPAVPNHSPTAPLRALVERAWTTAEGDGAHGAVAKTAVEWHKRVTQCCPAKQKDQRRVLLCCADRDVLTAEELMFKHRRTAAGAPPRCVRLGASRQKRGIVVVPVWNKPRTRPLDGTLPFQISCLTSSPMMAISFPDSSIMKTNRAAAGTYAGAVKGRLCGLGCKCLLVGLVRGATHGLRGMPGVTVFCVDAAGGLTATHLVWFALEERPSV